MITRNVILASIRENYCGLESIVWQEQVEWGSWSGVEEGRNKSNFPAIFLA